MLLLALPHPLACLVAKASASKKLALPASHQDLLRRTLS